SAGKHLLVSNALCHLAVGAILGPPKSKLRMLLRTIKTSVRTEQSFCGLIDAKVEHVIGATEACKLLLTGHKGIVLHRHIPKAANDGVLEFARRSRCRRIWGASILGILLLQWVGYKCGSVDRRYSRVIL